MINRALIIATAPNYRPSGWRGTNKIFSKDGCAPTLTTQCAHVTPPLVMVGGSEE